MIRMSNFDPDEPGASKAFNLTNHNSEIKFVDFSKEIIIPELPPLPEIPLTEEDK